MIGPLMCHLSQKETRDDESVSSSYEDEGGYEVLLDETKKPEPTKDNLQVDEAQINLLDDDFDEDAKRKQLLKKTNDAIALDLADDDLIGGF